MQQVSKSRTQSPPRFPKKNRLHSRESKIREKDSSCHSSNCTESVGEIVLDLLRGKVYQYFQQEISNLQDSGFYSICKCKFLIIIDVARGPQYWVVQMKNLGQKFKSLIDSQKNYLNCIESLQLYSSIEDVCCLKNRKMLLSNKNWFFFETLIRLYVAHGVDVLLEDFIDCNICNS